MRRILAMALALCLAAPALAAKLERGAIRYVDPGQLFVIDGDTVVYHGAHLRFLGIEAPELHAACQGERMLAIHAREVVVQELANARSVALRFYYRRSRYGGYRLRYVDKYGRALVDVFVSGKNLADRLVAQNLAVRWSGQGMKPNWCQ